MRVPVDPQQPSFDQTFKVGLGRWFTSSTADRREWLRRRNAAAQLARTNQRQRAADRHAAPTPAPAPQVRHAAQQRPAVYPAAPMDPTIRRLNRLARIELWLASIQLAAVLIPVLVALAVVGVVVWILIF